MSRNAKILIFSAILIYAFIKNIDNSETNNDPVKRLDETVNENVGKLDLDPTIKPYPKPENGFSPYNTYFGKGKYNNNSNNTFIIKNSNSTDAVVLLVNAYSQQKIRNEFIRMGSTFSMTGVPDGTYYLKWLSGNNWHPEVKIGNLNGGFQSNASASQSDDNDDWMIADGGVEWTITLYSVTGGNMDTESITLDNFGKK